jgi:tetratricopeptide (TPR) repeat protein
MATAVLERLRPGLGVALERLRTAPRHDRRALAARIDDALAARAELGPRDPIAILFHDLCYRLSVEGSTRDPVWTPLVRDMLQTQRRIDAGRKLSLYVGALTTLELERGDFAAALPLAQEGLQIAPSGRVYQRSRQSMLGAALAGLGRYEEAEALLRAGWPPESLPALTSTKCFGYMIDLYGASGRPEAALEFAGPVMHDALAKGSATFRDTLAWKVVRRPNLGAPLYALALDLARAASGADAGDADRLRALGAALLRAGEPQEAVAALTRADGMDGDGERLGTPLLAMALWGVGDEAAAREALSESRRLVEDLGDWCSQEIWSLVAEAEAMIE